MKLFLKGTDNFKAGEFYRKRALSIVLPYILWVVLYYIYYCATGEMSFSLKELVYYLYSGDLAGHFYFVIALLQFYILMPLWVWLFKKVDAVILLPASLFITILFGQYLPNLIDLFVPNYFFRYYDRVFTSYLFWWCLGCSIGLNYSRFIEILKKNTGFIVFLLMLSLCFDGIGSILVFGYGKPQNWLEIMHMLYIFSALLFLMRAAVYYSDSAFARSRLIRGIDRASYLIYLTHCLTLAVITRLMDKIDIEGLLHRYAVRIVVVYGVTITLCMLYKRIRNGQIKGV